MALCQIFIHDFRNLEKVELEPLTQGFNFLYGQNGSGKTSFLEAIYYLGHRRSFRSIHAERLIRYNTEQFNLFSNINSQSGQAIPLGMKRHLEGDYSARVNGKNVDNTSELASLLPIRLMNVHSHSLLEGSPSVRRQYLDWGIFYQNQDFRLAWLRFKRLLKQRNAALRMHASHKELLSWSQEFAEAALQFHELRLNYLDQLLPFFNSILSQGLASFFDLSGLSVNYQSGWDLSQNYIELLAETLPRDRERGYTGYGPHRADLRLKINGIPAKEVLSTGQQKLLVCGMLVAQGALLEQRTNKPVIYLVDDLPAELDVPGRHWLIKTLAEQQAQIFVTAVEQEAMSELLAQVGSPVKMFHVKQGQITEKTKCST